MGGCLRAMNESGGTRNGRLLRTYFTVPSLERDAVGFTPIFLEEETNIT
jgi:hypothetical protein